MFSRSAQVLAALTLLELIVFLLAATQVDVLLLVLVVLALSVSGFVFLFRQTAGMLRRSVEEVLSPGNGVERQLGDRALKLAGAALLAFPGLLTGLFGGLLMLAPVRSAVRPLVGTRLAPLFPAEVSASMTEITRTIRRRDVVDVDVVTTDPQGSETKPSAPPELR